MTNFIFKSPRGLIKNVDNMLLGQLKIVQGQNRALRQDLVDVKLMLNKLLINKHLQQQVDEYFDKDEEPPEVRDLD